MPPLPLHAFTVCLLSLYTPSRYASSPSTRLHGMPPLPLHAFTVCLLSLYTPSQYASSPSTRLHGIAQTPFYSIYVTSASFTSSIFNDNYLSGLLKGNAHLENSVGTTNWVERLLVTSTGLLHSEASHIHVVAFWMFCRTNLDSTNETRFSFAACN